MATQFLGCKNPGCRQNVQVFYTFLPLGFAIVFCLFVCCSGVLTRAQICEPWGGKKAAVAAPPDSGVASAAAGESTAERLKEALLLPCGRPDFCSLVLGRLKEVFVQPAFGMEAYK